MNKRKQPEAPEQEPPPEISPLLPTSQPPVAAQDVQTPPTEPASEEHAHLQGTLPNDKRRNLTVITQTDGNVPFYSSVKELMDVGALLVISRTQLRQILTNCLLAVGTQVGGTKMELLQSLTLLHYVLSRRLGFLTSLYIVLESSLDELDESRFFKIGKGLVSICELEVEFEVYHFDHALIVTKIDFVQLKQEAEKFQIQARRNASFGQGGQNVYKCDTPLWWTENRNKFYFNVLKYDDMKDLIRPATPGSAFILAALVQISEGYPRAPADIFSNKRPKKLRGAADFFRVTSFHQANIMRTVPNAHMVERETQTEITGVMYQPLHDEQGPDLPPTPPDLAPVPVPEVECPPAEDFLPSVAAPPWQGKVPPPAVVEEHVAEPVQADIESGEGPSSATPHANITGAQGQLPTLKVAHATARPPKSALNVTPLQAMPDAPAQPSRPLLPHLASMLALPLAANSSLVAPQSKPNLSQCAQLGLSFGVTIFKALGGSLQEVSKLQGMSNQELGEMLRESDGQQGAGKSLAAPQESQHLAQRIEGHVSCPAFVPSMPSSGTTGVTIRRAVGNQGPVGDGLPQHVGNGTPGHVGAALGILGDMQANDMDPVIMRQVILLQEQQLHALKMLVWHKFLAAQHGQANEGQAGEGVSSQPLAMPMPMPSATTHTNSGLVNASQP